MNTEKDNSDILFLRDAYNKDVLDACIKNEMVLALLVRAVPPPEGKTDEEYLREYYGLPDANNWPPNLFLYVVPNGLTYDQAQAQILESSKVDKRWYAPAGIKRGKCEDFIKVNLPLEVTNVE